MKKCTSELYCTEAYKAGVAKNNYFSFLKNTQIIDTDKCVESEIFTQSQKEDSQSSSLVAEKKEIKLFLFFIQIFEKCEYKRMSYKENDELKRIIDYEMCERIVLENEKEIKKYKEFFASEIDEKTKFQKCVKILINHYDMKNIIHLHGMEICNTERIIKCVQSVINCFDLNFKDKLKSSFEFIINFSRYAKYLNEEIKKIEVNKTFSKSYLNMLYQARDLINFVFNITYCASLFKNSFNQKFSEKV